MILVDVRSTPITEVNVGGIRTTSGIDVDVIVFATGFDAMTGPLLGGNPTASAGDDGREGAAGPRTYLGLAIAGFPNLFTVTGPGSPSVLTNVIVSIEQHVEWVADLLVAIVSGARPESRRTGGRGWWVDHVNGSANHAVPRADVVVQGANVPGKPRVFMPYVGGFGLYRRLCAGVAADGYRGSTDVIGHRRRSTDSRSPTDISVCFRPQNGPLSTLTMRPTDTYEEHQKICIEIQLTNPRQVYSPRIVP